MRINFENPSNDPDPFFNIFCPAIASQTVSDDHLSEDQFSLPFSRGGPGWGPAP
jgi:hypothetical protein